MSGEGVEAFGSALALIGFLLSIVVTAGILVSIDAGIILWVAYIVELLFLVAGAVLQGIGEHL